jgi:hypothetical protein
MLIGMRSLRIAVLGLALTVALTGCVAPDSESSEGPAGTPEATSAAEQQRETGLTRPALVFDGACDQLFSDAELALIAGDGLSLTPNHFSEVWGGDALFNQNGGFECTWTSEKARVIALVLPEAAVSYAARDESCRSDGLDGPDAYTCDLESVVNGIRLSGLSSIGNDEATATAARDALLAIFSDKASREDPVPVPLPALGSWALPPDCAAVASAADFSAVPGLGADAAAAEFGYGKQTSRAEGVLTEDWFGESCYLTGESASIEFVPIGGARWREASIAARADATALTLDGVESAYSVPYVSQGGESLTLVYAFSGPNMLMFTARYTKNAAGIATALFASLDATAVS